MTNEKSTHDLRSYLSETGRRIAGRFIAAPSKSVYVSLHASGFLA
jgi:hypothetical protein